jgi:hyperosmotically inducible periplasmic protein
MDIRPKVRNAALMGALAAVAATAWATSETITESTYVPAYNVSAEQPVVTTDSTLVVSETLSPNESVVSTSDPVPVVERSAAQPPIVVEARRLSEDERIQSVVMDKLASNPRLSGKIGVESNDSVVRLTGYTITAGQAWRAGREAGSVEGVKYVQNEIRPRIGGSV